MNSISSSKSIVCCISSDAARSRSSDVFSGRVLSFTIMVDRSVDAGGDLAAFCTPDTPALGTAVVDAEHSAPVTYSVSTMSNGISLLIFCTVRSICFFFLDSLGRRGLTGLASFSAVSAGLVDAVDVFFTLFRNFGITMSFSPVLWSTL